MQRQHDVVIIGAGPSGTTAANILAQNGLDVAVIEKDHFPRFHIGESLLPATVRLFERLDVHERIRSEFIRKPGGKWLYGPKEVPGDFDKSDDRATFKEHPYSYLVERSLFDQILTDRAAEVGAEIHFGQEVQDVITDGDRVVGVRCRDQAGVQAEFRGRLVIDATGLRALIPAKFGLREITKPQRMGIYAQYAAKPARDDVQTGWFVGQMFYDGWTWLMQLPGDRFSVGVVLTVDRFRQSKLSPTELLERMVGENDLLNNGMSAERERISDVLVTGNMGSRSDSLAGNGWVTVGDAAYFIDPCYSSGVHLAMKSAEMVAEVVLEQPKDVPISEDAFASYIEEMRSHEKLVHKMVEAFYLASRNTSVQKMVTSLQGGHFSRRFVTFVGGDFLKNHRFINIMHKTSKLVSWLFGNSAHKRPETSPEYLIAPTYLKFEPPTPAAMPTETEPPQKRAA